jgi:hypothetical protein
MKTKLDLYLAVQNLAHATLGKSHPDAEKEINGLLTPLNLSAADHMRFGQQFYSRRQAMLDLKDQPLVAPLPKA